MAAAGAGGGGSGQRRAPATGPPGVDAVAVTSWLCERVPALRPPLRFSLLTGGRSNLTFRVDAEAGPALVLRRPPLRSVLPGAHDMAREHRIVSALGPTPVPVPPAVGLCEDEAVTGAPFFAMRFVEGAVLRDADGARAALDEPGRERAACSLVDTLAELHAVRPEEVGLDGLGRREDYAARQLRTWSRQWERSRTRELPAVEEAHARLAARLPRQQRSGIVHGDYRLDNVILGAGGDVAAVVDWELCTLGDPLADLGLLLVYWGEAGDEGTALPDAPSTAAGFPGREALAGRYAATTGLDLGDLDYYVALGFWKLAVVLEGVHARARAGAYGEAAEGFDGLTARVDWLAAAALEATARAGR